MDELKTNYFHSSLFASIDSIHSYFVQSTTNIHSSAHKQFISSCGNMGGCRNSVWNMVFVGDAAIQFNSDGDISAHTKRCSSGHDTK